MLVKEYFQGKRDKLVCGCGCGLRAPRRAVEMVYAVRIIFGIPVYINSSVRCRKHNKAEGGSKLSIHLPWYERDGFEEECGFDVVAESRKRHRFHEYRLINICQYVGFVGIGHRDNTFLHIDNRRVDGDIVVPAPINGAVWGYPK